MSKEIEPHRGRHKGGFYPPRRDSAFQKALDNVSKESMERVKKICDELMKQHGKKEN